MGRAEDAGGYESYQNESETTTLLSPSPPSSPGARQRRGGAAGVGADVREGASTDVRKHYKRALGAGYMFAMGVCGIVLVALGSTLDDLADNCGTTSIAVCCERTQIFSLCEIVFVLSFFPSPCLSTCNLSYMKYFLTEVYWLVFSCTGLACFDRGHFLFNSVFGDCLALVNVLARLFSSTIS